MESIHNKVLNKIVKNRRGKLFFPSDFSHIGTVDAVKTSLYRLEKEKVLERLGQGIYLYPKIDSKFGSLYPSTEEIAEAIARRDHVRIVPTGSAVLHKLGLSTQVPMNVTYLTDGTARKIKVGKQKITFKAATAKKFATKGKVSTLVIQALQELGAQNIDEHVLNRIQTVLKEESTKNLIHDAQLAPAWIRKILDKLISSINK